MLRVANYCHSGKRMCYDYCTTEYEIILLLHFCVQDLSPSPRSSGDHMIHSKYKRVVIVVINVLYKSYFLRPFHFFTLSFFGCAIQFFTFQNLLNRSHHFFTFLSFSHYFYSTIFFLYIKNQ